MKSLKDLSLMEKIGGFVLGFIAIGVIVYGIKSLSKGYLASFGEYFLSWGAWLGGLLGLAVIAYFIYRLIKKFKNWKTWSLWLKGGIIGFGIYTFMFIITFILHRITNRLPKIVLMILVPGAYILRYTLGSIFSIFRITKDIVEISISFIISIIIGFVIGALIGLIIQKLRKRNN